MLELFLLRHGKAEPARIGQRDHERPLAERGRMEAHRQGLAFPCKASDALVVSDAVRTQQTLQSLLDAWDSAPPHHITPTGYLADADTWVDLIGMTDANTKRLWVVGHNPGISDLVLQLTGDRIGMSTADVVHIELEVANWSGVGKGSGHLKGHHPGRNA